MLPKSIHIGGKFQVTLKSFTFFMLKYFFQALRYFIEVTQVRLNIIWLGSLGAWFQVQEGSKITPI